MKRLTSDPIKALQIKQETSHFIVQSLSLIAPKKPKCIKCAKIAKKN